MFITFEGAEASGKSTQVKLLYEKLKTMGRQVILTREPGGTPNAEEIRSLLLSGNAQKYSAHVELLLFTAARKDHLEKLIIPSLDQGKIVISDRYTGSSYALQGACGIDTSLIDTLCSTFSILRPDLVIYLDIDPETSFERINQRFNQSGQGKNRFEEKGLEYHRRVSHQYNELCNTNSDWFRINAKQSINEIHTQILRKFTEIYQSA